MPRCVFCRYIYIFQIYNITCIYLQNFALSFDAVHEFMHACMCTSYVGLNSNCFHTIMQVIWDRLYNTGSARDKGTLYQFRNALRRTAVARDVSTNVHGVEDLLQVSDLLYALIPLVLSCVTWSIDCAISLCHLCACMSFISVTGSNRRSHHCCCYVSEGSAFSRCSLAGSWSNCEQLSQESQ